MLLLALVLMLLKMRVDVVVMRVSSHVNCSHSVDEIGGLLRNVFADVQELAILSKAAAVDNVQTAQVHVRRGATMRKVHYDCLRSV